MRRTAKQNIKFTDAAFGMKHRLVGTYGEENATIMLNIALDIAYRIGDRVVVCVGITPPEHVDVRIRNMLAAGTPTTLPLEVTINLFKRREDNYGKGNWQENHYSPGIKIYPKEDS